MIGRREHLSRYDVLLACDLVRERGGEDRILEIDRQLVIARGDRDPAR